MNWLAFLNPGDKVGVEIISNTSRKYQIERIEKTFPGRVNTRSGTFISGKLIKINTVSLEYNLIPVTWELEEQIRKEELIKQITDQLVNEYLLKSTIRELEEQLLKLKKVL